MTMALGVNKQFSLGGKQFNETDTILGTAATIIDELLPVAQPGVQSATGATTTAGTVTMTNSPHHITTGMIVDVYWAAGYLVGATVGTVAGQAVPLTGGTYYGGPSALPATNTPMIVCQAVAFPLLVVAANMQALLVAVPGIGTTEFVGTFTFANASPTIEYEIQISAGGSDGWYVGNGITNPLSADITQVFISHTNVTTAPTLRVGMLTN